MNELDTVHVVEFNEHSYGLQHPLTCRPNLLDCRYNTYLSEQLGPAKEPGRYIMTLGGIDGKHAEYTRVEM